MKVKSRILQTTVALNIPTVISNFLVYVKAVLKAMTSNSYFEASAPKLTKLSINIDILDKAETSCNTKPPTGSVEDRDVALAMVKADLKSLQLDVQDAVNHDPDHAAAIIKSAGMSVKKPATHGKQQNTAEDGIEEGSVNLGGEGAGAHEWRMSTDEITWIPLPSSIKSKTTVTDLTPGVVYSFQNRRMLHNDEKSEWSQSIKIRVR